MAILISTFTMGFTEQVTYDQREEQLSRPERGSTLGVFENHQQGQSGWSGVSRGKSRGWDQKCNRGPDLIGSQRGLSHCEDVGCSCK